MHVDDKSMATSVGVTVLVLVGMMVALIIIANIIA